uniref:Glutathione S-transferase rho n=1 Tax=Echeneis naucrates TaxID=173247 RepID=A0A665TCZ7_ECHNA
MAQDMTLLWGSGSPPCWRVMIALEEKNLQGYNQKLLSFEKMEHKSQEVLDINPRGQLPTFKHGDITVNESYAACFYLESQFKSQGNKLIPDSPAEQALMYQRMFEGLTFYEKLIAVVYYDWFVPEGEKHDSALQRNKEVLGTELKLWEGYLQKPLPGAALHSDTMAKDMTLLWGSGSPPCWRVMIALEEKNLQGYNKKLLSFEKMEHKSPEVMSMNPRGQLPSFKHGNSVLNESYGACMYLESQFKSQGNKLIPDCPVEQAQMYQRMFEGLTLSQKTGDVIYYNWKVPEGERHDSAVKRNKESLSAELKLWEGYLQKASGSFLAGKTFSLADVTVYPSIAYLFQFGLSEERYPKLTAYYNSLKDRPSIKTTRPPTWLESPQGQSILKDI